MKKIIAFILVIVTMLSFSGCSLNIEDTNGASDYSLSTLTDADIVKNSESRTMTSSYTSTKNDKTTMSVKKFSGVYTVKKIIAGGESYTFDFDVKVESGNLRVVIVDRENQTIVKDVKINEKDSFVLDNLSGTYQIKLAGESAKLSLEFSVKEN